MYRSFKEMPVWREAMAVAEDVFRISEEFPRKEDYGLTTQLRRSALSISANIAEAFGRKHSLDKRNFYYYARGSAMETENHLEYARRVGYVDGRSIGQLNQRLRELYAHLNKVIASLKSPGSQPQPQP